MQQFYRRARLALYIGVITVVTTGCSQPFSSGESPGEGTAAATANADATPTKAAMMPIVTPTPVAPGATVVVPEAPGAETENPETYVVGVGDSLYAIALRFGVEIQAIIELNGLSDPNDIQAGQELRIPPRQ